MLLLLLPLSGPTARWGAHTLLTPSLPPNRALGLAAVATPNRRSSALWMGATGSRAAAEVKSAQAVRFEAMLEDVAVSDRVLVLLKRPRERALLQGVRAALAEPAVLNAFTVLYEDVAPVRLAGDVVFKALSAKVAQAASAEEELHATLGYEEAGEFSVFGFSSRRFFCNVGSFLGGGIRFYRGGGGVFSEAGQFRHTALFS